MAESFKKMKNFWKIFIAKNVSICLVYKTGSFQSKKRENYWLRTLKILARLELKLKSTIWPSIYYIHSWITTYLDMTIFRRRTSEIILYFIFTFVVAQYSFGQSIRVLWESFHRFTMRINWLFSMRLGRCNRSR